MMTEWLSLKLVRSRMVSGWTTKLEQLRTGRQPWEKGKCDRLVVVFFNPLCHSFVNFFLGGVQLPIRVETIFQGLLYNPIAKFHLHACWESLYGPTKRSIIYNPIFFPEPILCPSISRSIVWDLFFLRSVCFFLFFSSQKICHHLVYYDCNPTVTCYPLIWGTPVFWNLLSANRALPFIF